MASPSSLWDWTVIGEGLAGTAAAYELICQGFSVLLLDAQSPLQATRYSYGGIPYWSGTTPLMQQLCHEGLDRHRALPAELEADTQFREIDLLLTVDAGDDPQQALQNYLDCSIPPTVLSVSEACRLEPLLNSEAIAGALTVRHGHVDPVRLIDAYCSAFIQRGGVRRTATVTQIISERGGARIVTAEGVITSANTLVCAGGLSRHLLGRSGLSIRLYFTHAELLETPPLPPTLRTLVMPANGQRFALEADASEPKYEGLWQQETQRILPPILDAGAIQFLDGRICMGQISRALGNPFEPVDLAKSEARIRHAVGRILPALGQVAGQCHRCLVAFSSDGLPLIGTIPGSDSVYIFSGFGSPFAILPPLAQRFAAHVATAPDEVIAALSPHRPSLSPVV